MDIGMGILLAAVIAGAASGGILVVLARPWRVGPPGAIAAAACAVGAGVCIGLAGHPRLKWFASRSLESGWLIAAYCLIGWRTLLSAMRTMTLRSRLRLAFVAAIIFALAAAVIARFSSAQV